MIRRLVFTTCPSNAVEAETYRNAELFLAALARPKTVNVVLPVQCRPSFSVLARFASSRSTTGARFDPAPLSSDGPTPAHFDRSQPTDDDCSDTFPRDFCLGILSTVITIAFGALAKWYIRRRSPTGQRLNQKPATWEHPEPASGIEMVPLGPSSSSPHEIIGETPIITTPATPCAALIKM